MSGAAFAPGPGSWAAALAAAFLLCLAALWNGQPVFYPDTPTYVRGAEMGVSKLLGPGKVKPWLPPAPAETATTAAPAAPDAAQRSLKPLTSVEDKIVLAGRSVYYGALVYLGYLGSMWVVVAVQAVAVAYVLQLLMVRIWGLRSGHLVGTVAALAVVTPLAAYTGFLMPDIFAPLAILSMGLLAVYWARLRRLDRWALGALLLFSLCAHASHVALAALLLALLLAARTLARRWRGLSIAGLGVAALCIAGAVAGELAFNLAVTKAVGAPPLRLPHPMARLIDMGPGTAYLQRHCPQAGLAACAYLKNYPTAWDDFLFSTDPAKGAFALADADTKRRLSGEQLGFIAAVVRHDPLGVAGGVGLDVLRQLGRFGVDFWGYRERELAMYAGRMPAPLLEQMERSRAAHNTSLNRWWTYATYASVLAALAMAAAVWLRAGQAAARQAMPAPAGFSDFAAVAIAGVVANAVVCAALASSLDRFQSRVVWLIPFLVLAWLCLAAARRTAPSGAATTPSSPPGPSLQSPLQGNPQ